MKKDHAICMPNTKATYILLELDLDLDMLSVYIYEYISLHIHDAIFMKDHCAANTK